jgi:hypothetical protein
MVSSQETVFCWVPATCLTMVVHSVALFTPYILITTHKQVVILQVGSKISPLPMYKPSTYLAVSYLFSYLSTYIGDLFLIKLVTKVKSNSNSVEIHPQLSTNGGYRVDGALMAAGSLCMSINTFMLLKGSFVQSTNDFFFSEEKKVTRKGVPIHEMISLDFE